MKAIAPLQTSILIAFPLAVLTAMIAGCQGKPTEAPVPERVAPFVDIRDGSDVSARGVIYAASWLAKEHDVEIHFVLTDSTETSILMIQNLPHGLKLDQMVIQLKEDGSVIVNDTLMRRDEYLEKLNAYGQGALMANALPVLLLIPDPGVPGTDLVSVFGELLESKISTIIPIYPVEPEQR